MKSRALLFAISGCVALGVATEAMDLERFGIGVSFFSLAVVLFFNAFVTEME